MYLYRNLGLPSGDMTELKIALTHTSYSKSGKDNSRYVFLGMYEAKGVVARILSKYKVGTGMQLQHSLGSAFCQDTLERLFGQWSLLSYIRCGADLEIEKYKHIFVYGVLGYIVTHYEPHEVEQFLLRHFVTDKLLLAHDPQRFNKRAILDALTLQHYGRKSHISFIQKDDMFLCEIKVGEIILVTHQSRSKEYTLKKAVEKALKSIIAERETEVLPYVRAKDEAKKQKEKEERAQKHAEFLLNNTQKKQKREDKAATLKAEKDAKEKARLKAKAQVKKAKERKKESQIVISADMNAAKRRRLEDKLK